MAIDTFAIKEKIKERVTKEDHILENERMLKEYKEIDKLANATITQGDIMIIGPGGYNEIIKKEKE